jgi:hypothetical protein
VLGTRVLGIGLDALEVGLGAGALDLELGHEDGHFAACTLGEYDRPLRRQEVEARQVLDVRLVEEDVAGELAAADVFEQPLATRFELRRRGAGRDHSRDQ